MFIMVLDGCFKQSVINFSFVFKLQHQWPESELTGFVTARRSDNIQSQITAPYMTFVVRGYLKALTDGSFGTVHGSWASKFGLGPPDARVERFGAALIDNCGCEDKNKSTKGLDVNMVLNLSIA